VLAADSRVTLRSVTAVPGRMFGPAAPASMPAIQSTYFDNATKLLSLADHPYVGIVTYGNGAIGTTEPRTAHSYMPEFEATLATNAGKPTRCSVEEMATELGSFFAAQWKAAGVPEETDSMVFLVAGFDEDAPYGRIFRVSVPNILTPVELEVNTFGAAWGGTTYFLDRLIGGTAPMAKTIARETLELTEEQEQDLAQRWRERLSLKIPYQFLPLQDCVDLATFLVKMTATVFTWTVGSQGVGGEIDVATITRADGFRAVHQKSIHPFA
jgi:hypothetical protein